MTTFNTLSVRWHTKAITSLQQKLAPKRTGTHWQDCKTECIQPDAEWPSVEARLLFTLICQWVCLTHPSQSLNHTCTTRHPLSLWSPPLLLPLSKNTGCMVLLELWLSCMWHDLKATAHMQWTFSCPLSKQPHLWKVRFTALCAHLMFKIPWPVIKSPLMLICKRMWSEVPEETLIH